jgi:multiple sugar transport system permease protein
MILTSLKSPDEVLDSESFLPREKLYIASEQLEKSTPDKVEFNVPVLQATQKDITAAQLKVPSDCVAIWTGGKPNDNNSRLIAMPRKNVVSKRFIWGNYTKAWSQIKPSFSVYFWNSFLLAVVGTVGVLFTSLLAAYAFAFFKFPGKDFVFTIFLATMMVPAQVLLIPNFLTLKGLRWYDTYLGLSVPWIAGVFGIFLLRQFFLAMPRELYDAAVVDGCTKTQFLFKVLLPLSKPSLITLGIFSFLGSWNSLLWPLIVTESADMRTIQVALTIFNQSEGTNWELLMAASTFCQIPLIVAYFLAQRQFIQGIARTGLKG